MMMYLCYVIIEYFIMLLYKKALMNVKNHESNCVDAFKIQLNNNQSNWTNFQSFSIY